MLRSEWTRWLCGPPLRGYLALLCAIVAIGIPAALRFAVSGVVTGCEYTPYLPFILICAILLPWWYAAAAALATVGIMGGMFGGSPAFHLACFFDATVLFLTSSAIMIGIAVAIRGVISALQQRGADESAGGIVFSLEKGEVWASWYGQGPPVLLGSQRKVSEMMQDFLAQEQLGKRLNAQKA